MDRIQSIRAAALAVALCVLSAGVARAQVLVQPGSSVQGPASVPAEPWMEHLLPDPDDPRVRAWAEQQRRRKAMETELRRFRAKYFGSGASRETRQIGLSILAERYDEPALYPLLVEVFERDRPETRTALLDLFAEAGTHEGDTTLAWMAVHDRDSGVRAAALDRLRARVEQAGSVAPGVTLAVAGGLRQERDGPVVAAAGVAEALRLYQMVPLMIAAQVGGDPPRGAGGTRNNLGWIAIGQQQAFVSDLQPVVSNSAVGFDPTLSVVTEGVVLEVLDAVVYTYRTEVFHSLRRLTSDALGRPTGAWGLDRAEWWAWYEREWKPWMEARATEAERAGG
jgi:hypothetical protein